MADLLTLENLFNLMVLLFLQAVLGFDNLLYISIESQRAPAAQQASVRRYGILIAIALRIVLLFGMIQLIDALSDPFYIFQWEGVITGGVNFSTLVFLLGGAFIMYTAVKEIKHLLEIEDPADAHDKTPKSAASVIALIVVMNLVFSFDSILSALAITDVFPVLAIAIIGSGLAMLLLADTVSDFIKRNRKYEVLGLFILLIVGVVLIGEAGVAAAHAVHDDSLAIHLFGYEVVPMSKTTFYFSIAVLVVVDIIQSGYQKKLDHVRAQADHALKSK
ncbi:tellurium resistance protein TerC [Rhodobacteraceae bacterium NNCM2]|nr:tellurium resistance protein TerC [Coraliihabitans acroporae]